MSTTSNIYEMNKVKKEGIFKRKVESESTHITVIVKGQSEEEMRVFRVGRKTKMLTLMEYYHEFRGVKSNTFWFLFDGTRIGKYHTPDELKLKDGDEINAMLYQINCFGPSSTLTQVSPLDTKRIVMMSSSAASKAEEMRECLRSLRRNHKDEDPRIMRWAFETLLMISRIFSSSLMIVRNVVKKPGEERYRRIRLTNCLFQERVGRFKEGIEFMELCGFKKEEGSEFLYLSNLDADNNRLRDAANQLNSAITNPFFSLLSTEAEDREGVNNKLSLKRVYLK